MCEGAELVKAIPTSIIQKEERGGVCREEKRREKREEVCHVCRPVVTNIHLSSDPYIQAYQYSAISIVS